MLVNSRGIVLSTLRYSDSSVIARIYTEAAGQKAFLVRVGKGRTAIGKMAVLQPLSLVGLSFVNDHRQGLRTPNMLERAEMLHAIPFDTVKSSIAIFISEVVGRSLQEEAPDMPLFSFLYDTILLLDREDRPCSNFHLKFLLEFSRFMGCHPTLDNDSDQPYFDLRESGFCSQTPIHSTYLQGSVKDAFVELISGQMSEHWQVQMNNADRRTLLQSLVEYYRFHLDGMREIRSHLVLEEVMS